MCLHLSQAGSTAGSMRIALQAMPELPEVETVRRGLAPRVVGRVFVDAVAHPSAKFQPALEAVGAEITAL